MAKRTAGNRPPPHPPGASRLDELLSGAPVPDTRVALRTDTLSVTYGRLDAWATLCARRLERAIGRSGTVIGLFSVAAPAFAAAYYAIPRSGTVIGILSPALGGAELEHALAVTRPGLIVAPAPLIERVRSAGAAVLGRCPAVVDLAALTGEEDPYLARGTEEGTVRRHSLELDPDEVACVQFTSGTTGAPKAALLSHANLCVNAAQITEAHGLGPGSVTLNDLPAYHPMHLNSTIASGATQVLARAPDAYEGVLKANSHRASVLYSLPVRLARLADDGRLTGLRLETVGRVLSGGSALPAPLSRRLAEHFGVPFLQGYGLAETSPLTHCDSPVGWTPGSVGPVVAGTEHRLGAVEDAEHGQETGQVWVRGPQVMSGYLDGNEPDPRDGDGWFPTGDVGRVEGRGKLVLLDRIKDVFKCDNHLVSPSQVEAVLLGHDHVLDAAVVDVPHPLHGAVPHALVVLRDEARTESVRASVNERLARHQSLRGLTRVTRIPRTEGGKLRRRELRSLVT